ncbi:MAG: DEAD/DEAH box helicase [Flavobacteriaceae bacterium]
MKKKLQSREYQTNAVIALNDVQRGICVAPAGSGKTIIAAMAINQWTEGRQAKIAWLAHTKEQCDQARKAIDLVIGTDYQVDIYCFAAEPDLTGYHLVIVDECHWAGCDQVRKTLRATMRKNECGVWESACTVWGFTATPFREDGYDITLPLGPICFEVTREDVAAAGGVLPAEVKFVGIDLPDCQSDITKMAEKFYTKKLRWADAKNGDDKQWSRCVYRAAKSLCIVDCEERNGTAVLLANVHPDSSVIILVETKQQGAWIESKLDDAVFVHSSVAGRAKKLEAFQNGEIRILIATSLADEGFDAPIASVLIMAGCGKALGKMIQRTGRVLRPYPGKASGIIYDFIDKGHGMLLNQSLKRRRIYLDQNYAITQWEYDDADQKQNEKNRRNQNECDS